ncbi:MAG: hypothetical protein U0559_11200 [Anaerolineae bacterium]
MREQIGVDILNPIGQLALSGAELRGDPALCLSSRSIGSLLCGAELGRLRGCCSSIRPPRLCWAARVRCLLGALPLQSIGQFLARIDQLAHRGLRQTVDLLQQGI